MNFRTFGKMPPSVDATARDVIGNLSLAVCPIAFSDFCTQKLFLTGGLYHVKRPEIGGLFLRSFINRLSEFNRRTN
ncbi:hypothetical protein KPN4_81 [Klebsiella phage KPN4]|uniref:Uncharacterized protein n=1 Tax=Klebsiella phage KPN4 TaxID=2601622 RepID=A0A5B9NAP6_9CAUD|nr:hypothetical protein KPN4_81 [Klebsiella phage KPN4]